MLAFSNEPALKESALALRKKRKKTDPITRFARLQCDIPCNLPPQFVRYADLILSKLPEKDQAKFFRRLLKAIPVGADLPALVCRIAANFLRTHYRSLSNFTFSEDLVGAVLLTCAVLTRAGRVPDSIHNAGLVHAAKMACETLEELYDEDVEPAEAFLLELAIVGLENDVSNMALMLDSAPCADRDAKWAALFQSFEAMLISSTSLILP